jgi:hypothetical protein
MIHRVLDEMELAALVGDAAKTCFNGLAQALMVVAGDETDPVQAALLKGFQKSAPMDFGFAQSAARPQDGAMSVLGDADGNKDSTVSETSVDTDFFEA